VLVASCHPHAAGPALGIVIGIGLATAIMQMIDTELVRLPLILTQANFTFAVLIVTLAATLSALWVSRRLRQLDLVGVLKARD